MLTSAEFQQAMQAQTTALTALTAQVAALTTAMTAQTQAITAVQTQALTTAITAVQAQIAAVSFNSAARARNVGVNPNWTPLRCEVAGSPNLNTAPQPGLFPANGKAAIELVQADLTALSTFYGVEFGGHNARVGDRRAAFCEFVGFVIAQQ